MPTSAYITIEGATQGPITQGAFTGDPIGHVWQEGHEEEVIDHTVVILRDPQISHGPGQRFGIPMDDRTTGCNESAKTRPDWRTVSASSGTAA
ncbi:hypothetical protein [Martelella mangrovi]|uniref:Type VI protein secretion system component Hcp n=1 Tax=Martelella mangrovi TaxID=1397477 RepID=A0ABV2IC08_9HYPH